MTGCVNKSNTSKKNPNLGTYKKELTNIYLTLGRPNVLSIL